MTMNKTLLPESTRPKYDPHDEFFHYRNLINGFPDTILRDYIEKAITEAFIRGEQTALRLR